MIDKKVRVSDFTKENLEIADDKTKEVLLTTFTLGCEISAMCALTFYIHSKKGFRGPENCILNFLFIFIFYFFLILCVLIDAKNMFKVRFF